MGVAESTAYDATKFVKTAFAVEFDSVVLGGTDGPVNIKPEITTEEVTCNQAGGKVLKKLITKIVYKITAKFKQPDTVLAKVFGLTGTISTALLGTDLLSNAKELKLSAIGSSNIVYDFKAAVAKVTNYDLDGEKLHSVEIEFETTEAGGADGTILVVTNTAPAG